MKIKSVHFIMIVCLAVGAGYVLINKGLPSSGHGVSASIQKYTCPMHPSYVSDKPGDCPICHMRLVPVDQAASKDSTCLMHDCPMLKGGKECAMLLLPKGQGGADCPYCSKHLHGSDPVPPTPASDVQVTPEGASRIGMRIEPVTKRVLTKEIPLQARIAYDPELYQAQLDYLQKTKRYNRPSYVIDPYSTEAANRARVELSMLGLSPQMIEEIKTWKRPDERLVGADPSGELWVYAHFYEEDAPFVKPGTFLELTLPDGRQVRTAILYVDAVVQSATRTVRARALVKNDSGLLKPDMYLQAKLLADLGERLAVPAEALLHAADEPYVFVRKEGDLFEPRTVRVGQKAGAYYEVLSGLTENESVIVSGNFLVDSESRIREAHRHG